MGSCREAPELSVGCKKTILVCLYCAKVFAGGGSNRFKQRLAGAKGEVEQCRKCPPDVRHQMRTTPGAQKSLQNCWQRKEAVERCDLALAKWMIDACVPFNALNSVYYQHAIDAVTAMGPGYKGPNLHIIRGYYLAKAIDEVKIYVETYREIWKKTENIVHMVTDNAANYVAASKLLMEEFPSIFWSLCAAHCINLILHDIGKLQSVCCVVEHGFGITKEWVSSTYAKDSKGKIFVESVLDSLFWEECAIIMRMSEPLIRVLRMVDGDDRPSMGYLYDAIHHAKEEMMRRFQKRKARVKPFIDIIIEDDPSILTTEEAESFHQALSTMTIQDTLDDDDCDDEVSKEHADDLLGVDEIGSIPSTFDPNFASMDTEELNVFIQQK
ncbi:uncharacterized protein LOC133681385 [Populus nigra]|uniref:uncharacterized protein LOC133681385 n=1 Tax=Populus nigra TaxID=3691 RepID=UPI002B266E46|nr:uncharacterized protein LOC133681385 [Populus nigra]